MRSLACVDGRPDRFAGFVRVPHTPQSAGRPAIRPAESGMPMAQAALLAGALLIVRHLVDRRAGQTGDTSRH